MELNPKFFVALCSACLLSSNLLLVHAENFTDDIFYVAKFVCGSIDTEEGPLRPGHYNTSISLINKHLNNTTFFWSSSVSDGHESHSTLISLASFQSTGIDCRDIKRVSGLENKTDLTEGFVLITVPQKYNPSQPNTVIASLDSTSGLEVQAFYTANALDSLPHDTVYEKITFYIIQDSTNKIPTDMFRTTLDVTLKSEIGKISNTELKIKKILADSYGINDNDLDKIEIRIKDVSIGASSMIDDHAISLSILKPQTSLEISRG